MNAGTITLNGNVFRSAQRYAKEHNVSVDTLVENIVIKAIGLDQGEPKDPQKTLKLKSLDELSSRVRSLIGTDSVSESANADLNGLNARMEYMNKKYGI